MHQDLAMKKRPDNQAVQLLEGLRDMIDSVRPHEAFYPADQIAGRLDAIIARFDADRAWLQDAGDVLFLPDTTAYGVRAAAVFSRWQEQGGGPSLPAMMTCAADYFGLPWDEPEMRVAMMAGVLAEMPNDLLYHGNEHYRKVMFHTIRLLVTHQILDFQYQPVLDRRDLMKMLIAATIHDLGHEGGDNLRDGIYTPGYMEQKAFDIIRPYFEYCGVGRDFWGEIETVVFCTDITFIAGDNSPCVRMKRIYRHFFMGDVPDAEIETMMIGKLRLFEDNKKLSVMAMLLHEADIATSAGLTYEQSKAETISIMEERDIKTAGPKTLLRFLTEQLGGRMMTPAAQKLFSGEMAAIMQQAENDVREGVETFYPA